MVGGSGSGAAPREIGSSQEYASLRDETLRRVELQDRISNLSILTAGAVLTFGTANSLDVALSAYPIVVLFFASAHAYNSMMLITLGCYLRTKVEATSQGMGWADFLKERYYAIENFERIAKYGLFVGVPILLLIFQKVHASGSPTPIDQAVFVAGCIATVLTIGVLLYPEYYHHQVLDRSPGGPPELRPEAVAAGKAGASPAEGAGQHPPK
jgi:type IV secretory pathway VirB2 component (pilin)